ncbi:Reticulocyte-binding protein-like protein [Emericellopsis cladophorae]|uniref:Reticulocyte-binding protein-like protein n=1 Tax=Emericellopsis cladophorae TaxID=2686198 RepID=A0A9P9Y5K6_9HYPO|nr:Reticulocyte-binding protein-like protein [Emericellopsis cladophorae]KAI6783841.1 Reticulocyte-binding protein-like protein [Emericellopsis cladophorae]
MDARNAAEPDQTRPADAQSPRQQPQQTRPDTSLAGKASLPQEDPLDESSVTQHRPASGSPGPARQRRNSDSFQHDDSDSDAETIVLAGKDGQSPSKVRKVRQEDKSDIDMDGTTESTSNREDRGDVPEPEARNHQRDNSNGDAKLTFNRIRNKDESSVLSSAHTSPRIPSRAPSVDSGSSEDDQPGFRDGSATKRSTLETRRPIDVIHSHKRKVPKSDSEDEEHARKVRRQRTASVGLDADRRQRDRRPSTSKAQYLQAQYRSPSPPLRSPRSHRRSASTQFSSSTGLSMKKKRLPPPLQPTDQSDESSASGSPYPRKPKARSLAASSMAETTASPAKTTTHKKHLDAHGRTLLARACAKSEFEIAKQRLRDSPEDLNIADYAGNTPLQIAALNGCEDIVKLLIDAGCNLDCVNYDKETPLLDAVENGHFEVIKLLLDAGVNPRKANAYGREPIDLLSEEADDYDEIREALNEARKRFGGRTKTSEDRHSHIDKNEGCDSPRRSPQPTNSASNRRGGTVRSTKTRNDLLYQPLDDKTLLQAAGRGDEEMVARILQVKGSCEDAEPMVAAARGGHDLVMQLLLGLGEANPDPSPVSSQPAEFATPILAAIGQENIKVLELLIEQPQVDPTKRFRGETYYEIARRRQGTNWKDEEQMLKNAYDAFKSSAKTKSPGRRGRERDRDEKRLKKNDRSDLVSGNHHSRSPSREGEAPRRSAKATSPHQSRKPEQHSNVSDERRVRKRDERTMPANASDQDTAARQYALKARRTESEIALSSEGETSKPRRKLVSKGALRGERDTHRRPSVTSSASAIQEHSSPHENRHDDAPDKTKFTEKYHDRAKALKREESKDSSNTHDGAIKRHRNSLTPDRPANGDKSQGEVPIKRRKPETETSEKQKRAKRPLSQSGARDTSNSTFSQAKSAQSSSRREHDLPTGDKPGDSKTQSDDASVRIKAEDTDVDMPDAESRPEHVAASVETENNDKRAATATSSEVSQNQPNPDVRRDNGNATDDRDQLGNCHQSKEEEHRADLSNQRENEDKKRKEDLERMHQEEMRKQRVAEEKAQREAEEKARRDKEEAKRVEAARKRKEADEQKRREEEVRLQREREAAEEIRRLREEEERRERERRDKAHREEVERKRAAREAEQRRLREEHEAARLDKLPPLLRWLDTCPNPKLPALADKFRTLQGVRYDTIRPEFNHTAEGREQWVLNTHAALLLGEQDLSLTRYTDWQRVPVSNLAKITLWRIESLLYSLLDKKTWELGQQLPHYYEGASPLSMSLPARERLREAAWERFRNMDLFFVRVSDLLYTIPNIPHLRNTKIVVTYRELIENDTQRLGWVPAQKWKHDPDANRYGGFFAPRNKYYITGRLVGEDMPQPAETSPVPFPEQPVPRRGLIQVFPSDPDYTQRCLDQGLEHLVNRPKQHLIPNGVHSPPISHRADTPSAEAEDDAHAESLNESRSIMNGYISNGLTSNGH